MLRAGYDVKLATGVICAGGCLGILIPPCIMLILYGATAGVSVAKLYAGAFFPGFMLAGSTCLRLIGVASNPELAPQLPPEERNVPLGTIVSSCWSTSFLPLALLILSVLGAILFGIATPTEAAAMGALGAVLLAACLPLAHLPEAQGDRCSHGAHLGDGLLAVRRLGALLGGVRLSRRRRP